MADATQKLNFDKFMPTNLTLEINEHLNHLKIDTNY